MTNLDIWFGYIGYSRKPIEVISTSIQRESTFLIRECHSAMRKLVFPFIHPDWCNPSFSSHHSFIFWLKPKVFCSPSLNGLTHPMRSSGSMKEKGKTESRSRTRIWRVHTSLYRNPSVISPYTTPCLSSSYLNIGTLGVILLTLNLSYNPYTSMSCLRENDQRRKENKRKGKMQWAHHSWLQYIIKCKEKNNTDNRETLEIG